MSSDDLHRILKKGICMVGKPVYLGTSCTLPLGEQRLCWRMPIKCDAERMPGDLCQKEKGLFFHRTHGVLLLTSITASGWVVDDCAGTALENRILTAEEVLR